MTTSKQSSKAPMRRTLTGIIVHDSADKTVRVLIERRVKHPLYGKVMRRLRHLLAHDEDNACRTGDTVVIEECPRYSKQKAWRVAERMSRTAKAS